MDEFDQKMEISEQPQEEIVEKIPGRDVYETVSSLVSALLVVVLVFTFLVRLMGVSGPSMIPTLQDGDRLLVVNSLLCGDYQGGDSVIARKGTFDSKPIVKRVIATAGQTVDIDFNLGQVYVDGELLDEDYINDYTYREEGTVFPLTVPEGEALAQKTFNPRLGITGGISILGTTGIVEPMSEQALLDTIHVELRQRRENGADYILLAPGNYGADYIRDFIGLDPKTAVLTSNFIGDSLEFCKEFGFHGALLIGHIGKFVKLAGGMWNTHSKFGDCRMEIIASHSAALGLRAERTEEILHCATCDDALRILDEEGLKDAFLVRLGQRIGTMLGYKSGELQSGAILFSKEYGFLCETEGAEELLEQIREG